MEALRRVEGVQRGRVVLAELKAKPGGPSMEQKRKAVKNKRPDLWKVIGAGRGRVGEGSHFSTPTAPKCRERSLRLTALKIAGSRCAMKNGAPVKRGDLLGPGKSPFSKIKGASYKWSTL